MRPVAGERTERPAVDGHEAGVGETAGGRVGPSRGDGVLDLDGADGAGEDVVSVVEQDALVVDETLAVPEAGEAHQVVVEQHEGLAGGHTALALIEADGDALVGEVDVAEVLVREGAGSARDRARRVTRVGEFVGVDEEVAVIHLGPGPVGLRGGPEGIASGKAGEVRVGDGDVLVRVLLLEELLADEVNDVVLLARGEAHLRRHEAESARERLVERERVGAVLEGLLPELAGVGDGARLLGVAVAAVAGVAVGHHALVVELLAPIRHEAGVVEGALVVGQGGFVEEVRRGRRERRGRRGRHERPARGAQQHDEEEDARVHERLRAGGAS